MQALMAIPRIIEWIVFACTETMAQRFLLLSRREAMARRGDEKLLAFSGDLRSDKPYGGVRTALHVIDKGS
jgi:hypothetical protein